MIEISEAQALFFRARRGHLADGGAVDVAAAARAMLGAQSQQLPPSLLALSLRTRGRPTAAAVKAQLLTGSSKTGSPKTGSPKLVRTWGQRDTLHIYDPGDWAHVVAARGRWAPRGRGGPMPTDAMLEKALALIRAARGPVTRGEFLSVAPASYVRAVAQRAAGAGVDARWLAASRLLWLLAHRGELCLVDKIGSEQAFALRTAWLPNVSWPKEPIPAIDAATALTRRYLGVYGPATAADVAHFFGARVGEARTWLAALGDEITPVSCGDRKGLVAIAADIEALRAKAPSSAARWPLRLLPLWESMLMAHADKSWTLPEARERPLVWRKAAYVCAVAIDRGRVVATWSHTEKRGRLVVEVQPLSGWSRTAHTSAVQREAEAVAAHLGIDEAQVMVARKRE